jgi:4-amino-4-deoxy-L-arabinose transferase-like glycosyltransferase
MVASQEQQHRSAGLWIYIALALLIAGSVAGNLYWVQQNVVQLGNDASGHLSRTLGLAAAWTEPSLPAFLRAINLTDFRPPLLYVGAQPFYWLWGRSIDAAQYANITASALVLLLTFFLGRETAGPRIGLAAAALTALLPIFFGMARLFYSETLVTLWVVAALWSLIRSRGFAHRGWTLAFGVALGLGMLTKWTLPIYLILPAAVVIWQARLWQPPPQETTVAISRQRRWPYLVALAVGVGLAAFVYLPDRAYWVESSLGDWLFPAWALLFGTTALLVVVPARPLTNLLLGLAIGASLASLWYFPQSRFIVELSDVAWGTGEGDYEAFAWDNWAHYWRYFRLFYQYHLGLLPALLILPAGLAPWFWRGREWLQRHPPALLVWLTAAAPFLLLTFTSQTQIRNLVPSLPAMAILFTMGLLAFPSPVRRGLFMLWLLALGSHWLLVTVDSLQPAFARTALLWPRPTYAVAPASGITDPGYLLAPDILATIITAAADAGSTDPATLGVLVDIAVLHAGTFRYELALAGAPVSVRTLAGPRLEGVHNIIANQWLLIKDGDNRELAPPQRALLDQILAGAPWFTQLYRPVKRYDLPNGEHLDLYRRPEGPADPWQFSTMMGTDLPPIAETLRSWWSDGATLAYAEPEVAVWLGSLPLPSAEAIIPAPGQVLTPADVAGVEGPLLVALRYSTEEFQRWLDQEFLWVQEVTSGEFTLILYAPRTQALTALPVTGGWPEVAVTAVRTRPQVAPGDVTTVVIETESRDAHERKVSLRLLDPAGAVIAQRDAPVTPEMVTGFLVPPAAQPGAYQVTALLYDPVTLAPIATDAGAGELLVATIQVVAP